MSAPIGSIIAFGGTIDRDWEDANGWLLCDGRLLDRTDPRYAALGNAIGDSWGRDPNDVNGFRLPDLRGYFVRGVDNTDQRRDPDGGERFALSPGGHTGNSVGSYQGWGTALPPDLQMSDEGRHHHTYGPFELDATRDVDDQSNTVAYPGSQDQYTSDVGPHSHTLKGGTVETRPLNAAVYWIICFR